MAVAPVGAVVLVRFPFSDLSAAKLRPALVLAAAGRGDLVLCQITSSPYGDSRAIPLTTDAFSDGSLPLTSYVRPAKLFTAHESIVSSQRGVLRRAFFEAVVHTICRMLDNSVRCVPA